VCHRSTLCISSRKFCLAARLLATEIGARRRLKCHWRRIRRCRCSRFSCEGIPKRYSLRWCQRIPLSWQRTSDRSLEALSGARHNFSCTVAIQGGQKTLRKVVVHFFFSPHEPSILEICSRLKQSLQHRVNTLGNTGVGIILAITGAVWFIFPVLEYIGYVYSKE